MATSSPVLTESERDQIPHYRPYRDLRAVPTIELERQVDHLGAAILRLRQRCPTISRRPLEDALVEIERELINRLIAEGRALEAAENDLPPESVVGLTHGPGLSGWTFYGSGI